MLDARYKLDMKRWPIHELIAQRAASTPDKAFSREDQLRYSRHMLLEQVGEKGQKILGAARVLIVGIGGLGSPIAIYLAAAGVGTLGLADFDQVDLSNLQRQILYRQGDIGYDKIDRAKLHLNELNPNCKIIKHSEQIHAGNLPEILDYYDLVIDGSDNFATRYAVSDRAALSQKPYIYGTVQKFSGQISVFYPPHGPCYRCLFPAPPKTQLPRCSDSGVLGPIVGQIGTFQATEAIKLILGIGEPLIGRILTLEALSGEVRSFNLSKDPECPACGLFPSILPEPRSTPPHCDLRASISPKELQTWQLNHLPHTVFDLRLPGELPSVTMANALSIDGNDQVKLMQAIANIHPTVLVCKSGYSSLNIARDLRNAGYHQVYSLEGGLLSWVHV